MRKNYMRAALVVSVALGAWACGSDGMRMVGDAARDTGMMLADALVDAGDATVDGAGGDAAAQPPTELPCDQEYTFRADGPDGSFTEQTYFFAETEGLPPGSRVQASVCGRTAFASDTPACPDGWTCSGEARPFENCTNTAVEWSGTATRVHCGFRQIVSSSGSTTTLGTRWTNAYIWID